MATNGIPKDIYTKGAVNQQWVKWIGKLKNLFVAADF